MVNELQYNYYVNWQLNTTFLTLLPMGDNPILDLDYRPISLLYKVYKILVKMFSLRLDKVIDSLVSHHQGATVKARFILEQILIVNELVDFRIREKIPGTIYKVDFYKAFDCVSWKYMEYIFDNIGFGLRWRGWIKTCLSTTRFSFLFNGKAKNFFQRIGDIRPGDRLSLMLFVLYTKALTRMVYDVQE